jgi:hypothetical protein
MAGHAKIFKIHAGTVRDIKLRTGQGQIQFPVGLQSLSYWTKESNYKLYRRQLHGRRRSREFVARNSVSAA